MQPRSLNRLRLAFMAIGVVLLAPLGWLLWSFDQRLEAQRRLRHEVVAERIFDEVERELLRFLNEEAQRPNEAFQSGIALDAAAPYVLGYYTKGPSGTRDVTIGGDADKWRRVDSSLGSKQALPEPQGTAEYGMRHAPARSVPAKRVESASDALRSLNRADEIRRDLSE
jgi:hypothetical protein